MIYLLILRYCVLEKQFSDFLFTLLLTLLHFEKGSTLKGENLLPLGANSLLLEKTLFQLTELPALKVKCTNFPSVEFLKRSNRRKGMCDRKEKDKTIDGP